MRGGGVEMGRGGMQGGGGGGGKRWRKMSRGTYSDVIVLENPHPIEKAENRTQATQSSFCLP